MTASALPLPPGPKWRYPGHHLLMLRRDTLGTLTSLAHTYGDVARLSVGPTHLISVSHPELIRQVLVSDARLYAKGRGLERTKRLLGNGLLTSEGEFHIRQRRLAQPAFHRDRIATYGSVMEEKARRVADSWHAGTPFDVADEMTRLTLDIAGVTLFGANLGSDASAIGVALTEAFRLFRVATLPYTELLDSLSFLPFNRRFNSARATLDAIIYRIVRDRRASGETHDDLLSLLIEARDTEGDGGAMSDLQLRDEALTILLAGHETTANALAWTFYLLGRHPDVEARLRQELTAVLGDRPVTTADVPELRYTRAVLSEVMRLYPPAWTIGRKPLEDVEIGGFRAPRGSLVLMSQYIVHRDSRWWPEPDRFDPDRLEESEGLGRHDLSLCPFGTGPRKCIGEFLARVEAQMHLLIFARELFLRSDGPLEEEFTTGLNLLSKYDHCMRPEIRALAMEAV